MSHQRQGGSEPYSSWADVAEQLRDEGPRWAVVLAGTRAQAQSLRFMIRTGAVTCFAPAGHFETTSRVVDGERLVEVYARYVGPQDHP